MDKKALKIYRGDDWIPSDCSFHIFFSSVKEPEQPHIHDFIEIVYILSGSGTEYVGDGEYEVRRGDLIFINYKSTHSFVANENFSFINICFRPETVGDSLITPENAFALLQLTAFDELRRENKDSVVTFKGKERDEIETLLGSMLSEYRREHAYKRSVLESYMNILLVLILRKISAYTEQPLDSKNDTWSEIAEYIDRNLGEDLTLSALAQKCFYNPSYFSRAFKSAVGCSPTEFRKTL